MQNDYSAVLPLLEGARTVALCGHTHPDGDCLGSVLSVTLALRELGFDATPLLADYEDAPIYDFLEGYELLIPAQEYKCVPDVFISLDVPNPTRLKDAAHLVEDAGHVIVIDHHPDMQPFGEVNIGDPSSAAVGMMAWNLIDALGVKRTKGMAECCYVALMTDTGRFQFQNTTASALHCAAEMLDAGVSPSAMAMNVYQNRTHSSLMLESRAVDRIRVTADGAVGYTWITSKDFAETGATKDDSEGLPDLVRSLSGIEVAVLLRSECGCIRASLRAKKDWDVGAVARKLGGGGHAAAAGFTIDDATIEETIEKLLSILSESKPCESGDVLKGDCA